MKNAIELAKRAREERINAIRSVGEARQNLADVREVTERELAELRAKITERVREAEQADVKAYQRGAERRLVCRRTAQDRVLGARQEEAHAPPLLGADGVFPLRERSK
ncbi:hypothetical protein [Actinomyces gaoshouyii]|uniref:hypothetical protein n=1 Tax=Actinomyces gaoshouyii TaxID=1960083 RepID=UPI00196B7443|nr:hypothetical protein [Actinomyces gaoshouyii]